MIMEKCNKLFPITLIIIGLITDSLVNITGSAFFIVTESYMDYIYNSVVTIAILSFSIIALITGVLNNTYYGYKLSEIIQFKESPINY